MKQVTVYVTKGGRQFSTEADAVVAEAIENRHAALRALVEESDYIQNQREIITEFLLSNDERLQAIYTS